MFRKEKTISENEEWIMYVGERPIPVKALLAFVKMFGWVILIFFAYTIGRHDAGEYFKYATYVNEIGGYDAVLGEWIKCYPVQNGSVVVWTCDEENRRNNEYTRFNTTGT